MESCLSLHLKALEELFQQMLRLTLETRGDKVGAGYATLHQDFANHELLIEKLGPAVNAEFGNLG